MNGVRVAGKGFQANSRKTLSSRLGQEGWNPLKYTRVHSTQVPVTYLIKSRSTISTCSSSSSHETSQETPPYQQKAKQKSKCQCYTRIGYASTDCSDLVDDGYSTFVNRRNSSIVNTICDGFTEALKIAKEATTGVPIAEPVLRGVVAAIELGKKVKSNWSEMDNMLKRIEKVQPVLRALEDRLRDYRFEDKASYLYLGILGCTETLKEEGDKIRNMQTHGLLMRIAQGTANADNLLSAYKNIEQAIGNLRSILARTSIAIERDTSTIRKNSALQSLPIASAAAYTSGIYEPDVVRRACTKGTRTEVLEDIRHWLQSENAAPVFWLTGAAGMGKTTIAMTICEEIEYLFCSTVATGPLDSGKPQYLLPTICRRLADFSSSYAGQLVCALEGDSGLATAKLDIQFEGCWSKPWQVSSSERTRDLPICIVVIDALDENGNGFLFLKKLLGAVRDSKLEGCGSSSPVALSHTLLSFAAHLSQCCVSLQEVPVYEVQQDISLYLQQELSGLRKDTLQLIVEQSCGLFIYAATVVKMATGSTGSTKGEQEYIIQELLNATSNSTNDHFLSKLYQQIVKDGLHHNNKAFRTSGFTFYM
ncbi:hypothetical protein D9758_015553 [Tetrapyrgos nigripes]|uniref:Nephrocystin 3-like N-terminal domain-containing protein n=1 Tax=Tetrapyrgos nigripes TaxID=182062 RepID=A0A8H5C540_9AGAR|nr:hypothetical protein D9758_015553 [Tetrapyrgos nigripes]